MGKCICAMNCTLRVQFHEYKTSKMFKVNNLYSNFKFSLKINIISCYPKNM